MSKKISLGGPGIIIAAAFIGPGTVTMCTLAGAGHGLQLLWAVLLSTIITIVFQEMACRLGIVTQLDLTSLIKQSINIPWLKYFIIGVVLSAIVVGNAAYEAGNISGGALGIAPLLPENHYILPFSPIWIGIIAFALLWFGHQRTLTFTLTVLVGLMSVSFVLSAILVKPDINSLLSGILIPRIPDGGLILVLGVIGTTVVPYNLFLHASLAKSIWKSPIEIKKAKKDTILAVSIGGLVSMAIVVAASSLEGQNISSATDMAKGLEPLYGTYAKFLIGIGLFAAGVTSAVTAPLAAAHVMCGAFNWPSHVKSIPFRITWMVILGIGVLFSSLGFKPIVIIRFAQVTNGLILPLIAVLLIWLSSKSSVLQNHTNHRITTIIGYFLIALLTLLGGKSIWMVFQ